MNRVNKIAAASICGLLVFYLYSRVSQEKAAPEKLIKNIMSYSISKDIIKRCQKDHNYTDEDMIILELELKKYFVLGMLKEREKGLGMYSKDVDNLWYTFILFTKDYAHFCKQYAHHFIHHVPETDTTRTPEKQAHAHLDFQTFIKKYEDVFHEEVHPIWFLDMCENDKIKL